jgi:hypothetical protein
LENIEYRRHPETMAHNKQDLDVYVNKMVQDKIGSGNIYVYEEYNVLMIMIGSSRN